ncbi:MAG: hypothetical protein SRB2_01252 [Desulfobacteraceae bacterium Eth-SRB2]|nr:MAG: hypothetical protein SRB2_01252 [Desulfobacteraceae bacterium Eth-SRB2]
MQYKGVMGKLPYSYKRFEILIPKSTLFIFQALNSDKSMLKELRGFAPIGIVEVVEFPRRLNY